MSYVSDIVHILCHIKRRIKLRCMSKILMYSYYYYENCPRYVLVDFIELVLFYSSNFKIFTRNRA